MTSYAAYHVLRGGMDPSGLDQEGLDRHSAAVNEATLRSGWNLLNPTSPAFAGGVFGALVELPGAVRESVTELSDEAREREQEIIDDPDSTTCEVVQAQYSKGFLWFGEFNTHIANDLMVAGHLAPALAIPPVAVAVEFVGPPVAAMVAGSEASQMLQSVSEGEGIRPRNAAGLFSAASGFWSLGKIPTSRTTTITCDSSKLPNRMVRVVRADVDAQTLGRPGDPDVFVTPADDIAGLSAAEIAERLTIPHSPAGFKLIEFDTPSNIGLPTNRSNPGYIEGGQTAGGAREFVVPNGPIPDGATTTVVR